MNDNLTASSICTSESPHHRDEADLLTNDHVPSSKVSWADFFRTDIEHDKIATQLEFNGEAV